MNYGVGTAILRRQEGEGLPRGISPPCPHLLRDVAGDPSHVLHYLGGTGEDLVVDPLEDVQQTLAAVVAIVGDDTDPVSVVDVPGTVRVSRLEGVSGGDLEGLKDIPQVRRGRRHRCCHRHVC